MTQISWNWACSPQVGDAGPLTVENLMIARMLIGNAHPDAAGVVHWTDATPLADLGLANPSDGLLEPTNPAGDIVRIASGIGMVQGWLYANDDDVDFDVSGGNANATDLIVLQRGDPAVDLTVRLAHLRGPVGGAATVTQNSLLWEVPIAEVLLDGSGNFSALTDGRDFVTSPLGVVRRQSNSSTNWNDPGTSNFLVGAADMRMQMGANVTDISGEATVTFPVPYATPPLIFLTAQGGLIYELATVGGSSDVRTYDFDGIALGNVPFYWLAIGPR